MNCVGRYAILINNSSQKQTWKNYGIERLDEQMNLIFSVLLFVMESSLQKEECTMDQISDFVGTISRRYLRKDYSYMQEKELADFMVNTILCNGGNAMNFRGFEYARKAYREFTISYLGNKIIYRENGERRTSYFLTEEGYNMVLSTMEIENHMKITIHEMLFRMHLEEADYKGAIHDVKNIFEQLRIQYQKIQDAMLRIRKNALSYSIDEYEQLIHENVDRLEDNRESFKVHERKIAKRIKELEELKANQEELDRSGQEELRQLEVIASYLRRSMEEQQRILNEHLDLKSLYDMELENYASMTMVQRYSFSSEIYDRVLENAGLLEHMEQILRPLFFKGSGKIYNVNLASEYQKRLKKKTDEEDMIELGFDEVTYRKEQEEKKRRRLKKYEDCVTFLMEQLVEREQFTLKEIREECYETFKEVLVPTLEIFREVIIEFLSAKMIDVEQLRAEQQQYLVEESMEFQLKRMILDVCEKKKWYRMEHIYVERDEIGEKIRFENVRTEEEKRRTLVCSNIRFWYD